MRVPQLLIAVSLVSLSACNSSQPKAAVTPQPTAAALPTTVPAGFLGTWALAAGDCAKDGAEGLLKVDADKLELGKDSAALNRMVEATEDRIRATFDFKGEGGSRTTDEVFDLRDGGKTLVRREFGDGASPMPFTYSKCG